MAVLVIVLIMAGGLGLVVLLALAATKFRRTLLDIKIDARRAVELQREIISRLRSHDSQSRQRGIWSYRQMESLLELNSLLGFRLTGLRGFAISPDAAVKLYNSIAATKPAVVLELGGGASSVVIAQALKANGRGQLITIDHSKVYSEQTRHRLSQYRLAKYAEVRLAPLFVTGDGPAKWYDSSIVKRGLKQIDYLVVDGPPEVTGQASRQPAISQLKSLLSPKVTIFVDDADRADVQVAIKSWLKVLTKHKTHSFETEKGTAILTPR